MASQSQHQWVQTRFAHIYDVTNILIIGGPIGILRHLWLISVISGIFLLLSLFGFLNPIFLKWELILGSNKNHFSLHKDWGREGGGGGNPVFDILVSKLELQYLLVTRTFTKNPVTNFVKHLEYEYSICFEQFLPQINFTCDLSNKVWEEEKSSLLCLTFLIPWANLTLELKKYRNYIGQYILPLNYSSYLPRD